MNNERFLVLVTFERMSNECQYLSDDCVGAVGYMAVKAVNAESVVPQLRAELLEVNLKLVGTEDINPLPPTMDLKLIDDHLASNVMEWEAGKASCWGTIHQYKSAIVDE